MQTWHFCQCLKRNRIIWECSPRSDIKPYSYKAFDCSGDKKSELNYFANNFFYFFVACWSLRCWYWGGCLYEIFWHLRKYTYLGVWIEFSVGLVFIDKIICWKMDYRPPPIKDHQGFPSGGAGGHFWLKTLSQTFWTACNRSELHSCVLVSITLELPMQAKPPNSQILKQMCQKERKEGEARALRVFASTLYVALVLVN